MVTEWGTRRLKWRYIYNDRRKKERIGDKKIRWHDGGKQFTRQQAVNNWWIRFYGARTRMWASTQAGWQVGERASGQACRQAGERVNKRGRSKWNTRHGNRHENHRVSMGHTENAVDMKKAPPWTSHKQKIGTRWLRVKEQAGCCPGHLISRH